MKRLMVAISAAMVLGTGCGGGDNIIGPVSPQLAPGTAARPILSNAEAGKYTKTAYFTGATSWNPTGVSVDGVTRPNFIVGQTVGVGGATHSSLQQAINAAIAKGGTQRIYIEVLRGTYSGTVYVPRTSTPITVYGSDTDASATQISLAIDGAVDSPGTYSDKVNPGGRYVIGDPAYPLYQSCATLTSASIGTNCSAVFWVQATGFEVKNLTVVNSLLDTVDSGTHQAVALRIDADQVQLDNVRLIGRQDTLFLNGQTGSERVYISNSYVEGDVDFNFGSSRAVYENCVFYIVSSRKTSGSVFAPDTVPSQPYGFLVLNSHFTADAGFHAGSSAAQLGRAWDQGASKTGYIAGSTPNGQLVIRESNEDAAFSNVSPWGAAATTSRPHAGNSSSTRNLDDPAYNRLWEYDNFGAGAKSS